MAKEEKMRNPTLYRGRKVNFEKEKAIDSLIFHIKLGLAMSVVYIKLEAKRHFYLRGLYPLDLPCQGALSGKVSDGRGKPLHLN